MDLGSLQDKGRDIYELTVGNHLLKGKQTSKQENLFQLKSCLLIIGKMQSLPRPMLLTQKNGSGKDGTVLEVQAVVRKKILFSTRPTPLRKETPSDKVTQAAGTETSQGEKRRKLN